MRDLTGEFYAVIQSDSTMVSESGKPENLIKLKKTLILYMDIPSPQFHAHLAFDLIWQNSLKTYCGLMGLMRRKMKVRQPEQSFILDAVVGLSLSTPHILYLQYGSNGRSCGCRLLPRPLIKVWGANGDLCSFTYKPKLDLWQTHTLTTGTLCIDMPHTSPGLYFGVQAVCFGANIPIGLFGDMLCLLCVLS